MTEYGLPTLYILFVWWFSTGVIFYLDGLPRRTHRWTMLGATLVMVLGLGGLTVSASMTSVGGAYCAFTCALMVWAWVEVGFLLGYITGPRTQPCPPGASGWRRFALATETLIYHELALVAAAVAVVALTWGQPNQVGTWTFVILWVMRQSAKINVFLGVRNLSEEFLPPHLQYLKSFFRRRPMNLLFPVSVTLSTVVTVLLFQVALRAESASFDQAAFLFLATLLTLAVLEHWFLVIPLPVGALWNWSLRSRDIALPVAVLVPVVEVPVSKPQARETNYLRSRPN